ncbi:MAG: Glyoxalase/Bleomycin resistance protein/Dioxygenase superfamily protein [Gemmatimonadetes bacterium]|nr:Glyoxalase/Bleomycin resistance protein/Dioxygenase superfamily protein [Gemmatimonadota bacterium]
MFAHVTLPTQHVEETTRFLEETLGYPRKLVPANSPVDARWLDIGHGQEMHVFFVEGFVVSPFEAEFGRHIALFHPLDDFAALRQRITTAGGMLVEPLRSTPFERIFFREPVNGYLFELIDSERHRQLLAEEFS